MRHLSLLLLVACTAGSDTAGSDETHTGETGETGETGTVDPGPISPSVLGASEDRVCAMDEWAIRCWGGGESPHVVSEDQWLADQVAVSGAHVCWGASTGDVHCGDEQGFTTVAVNALRTVGGPNGFCSVTGERDVTCWEAPAATPTQVPDAIGANRIAPRKGTSQWTISQANGVYQEWTWGGAASTDIAVRGSEEVAAGPTHTCTRTTLGTVECWGSDALGQTGVEGSGTVGAADRVTAMESYTLRVVGGTNHVCAMVDGGRVFCWGDNSRGQLGLGEVNVPPFGPSPAEVPGITGAVDIAAGDDFTCVSLDDSRVVCWGAGTESQLGGTTDSGTPVTVLKPAP